MVDVVDLLSSSDDEGGAAAGAAAARAEPPPPPPQGAAAADLPWACAFSGNGAAFLACEVCAIERRGSGRGEEVVLDDGDDEAAPARRAGRRAGRRESRKTPAQPIPSKPSPNAQPLRLCKHGRDAVGFAAPPRAAGAAAATRAAPAEPPPTPQGAADYITDELRDARAEDRAPLFALAARLAAAEHVAEVEAGAPAGAEGEGEGGAPPRCWAAPRPRAAAPPRSPLSGGSAPGSWSPAAAAPRRHGHCSTTSALGAGPPALLPARAGRGRGGATLPPRGPRCAARGGWQHRLMFSILAD
jgi:hypothetical protein